MGAAAPTIPECLIDQLKNGGRMIIPVGPRNGDQVHPIVLFGNGSLNAVPCPGGQDNERRGNHTQALWCSLCPSRGAGGFERLGYDVDAVYTEMQMLCYATLRTGSAPSGACREHTCRGQWQTPARISRP